jgi:hypothetical protein
MGSFPQMRNMRSTPASKTFIRLRSEQSVLKSINESFKNEPGSCALEMNEFLPILKIPQPYFELVVAAERIM